MDFLLVSVNVRARCVVFCGLMGRFMRFGGGLAQRLGSRQGVYEMWW